MADIRKVQSNGLFTPRTQAQIDRLNYYEQQIEKEMKLQDTSRQTPVRQQQTVPTHLQNTLHKRRKTEGPARIATPFHHERKASQNPKASASQTRPITPYPGKKVPIKQHPNKQENRSIEIYLPAPAIIQTQETAEQRQGRIKALALQCSDQEFARIKEQEKIKEWQKQMLAKTPRAPELGWEDAVRFPAIKTFTPKVKEAQAPEKVSLPPIHSSSKREESPSQGYPVMTLQEFVEEQLRIPSPLQRPVE
jgi:hypothetical protein